jgi:hypothetical protein
MNGMANIIVQISILINLALSISIIRSTYKIKNENELFRYSYFISLANILSLTISYILIPSEMFFLGSKKTILTLGILDFSETSRLYVKIFIIVEYVIILKYLINSSTNYRLKKHLNQLLLISTPIYFISIFWDKTPVKFQWIYLLIEFPAILFCCSHKIVDILHDFKIKNISTDPVFIAHFSIFFLYGTSLPLIFILSYKFKENPIFLYSYNILSSIIYSIFFLFIIKAIRCSKKILK